MATPESATSGSNTDGWNWHWEPLPQRLEPPKDHSILSGERLLARANGLEVRIKFVLSSTAAFVAAAPPDFLEDKDLPEGEDVEVVSVFFPDPLATWRVSRVQFKPDSERELPTHAYTIEKYTGLTDEQINALDLDEEPVEIATLDFSGPEPSILFSSSQGHIPDNSKTAINGMKRLLDEIKKNALLKPREKPAASQVFNDCDVFLDDKEGYYGYYVASEVARLATKVIPMEAFDGHTVRVEGHGEFEMPMIRVQSPSSLDHDWLIFPEGNIFLCEIDRTPPHVLKLDTLTDKYTFAQIAKDRVTLIDALAAKAGLKRDEETGKFVEKEALAPTDQE